MRRVKTFFFMKLNEKIQLSCFESYFFFSFTERIVGFIERIRWETFFFYKPGMEDNVQKYKFKSLKTKCWNNLKKRYLN